MLRSAPGGHRPRGASWFPPGRFGPQFSLFRNQTRPPSPLVQDAGDPNTRSSAPANFQGYP